MRKKKDFRQQPWWVLVFCVSLIASPLLFQLNPLPSIIFSIIITQIIYKIIWKPLYVKSVDKELAQYSDDQAKVMRELRKVVEGLK